MVSKKRSLEDAASPKAKKSKLAAEGSTDKKQKKVKAKVKADNPLESSSNIVPEEIDFPRGGGTTFTPQEVMAIKAEALKEADDLFKVRMKCAVSLFPRLCAARRNIRRRQKSYAKSRMQRVKAMQPRAAERKQMLFE
jgi:rRNA biogenesis protein RRP5